MQNSSICLWYKNIENTLESRRKQHIYIIHIFFTLFFQKIPYYVTIIQPKERKEHMKRLSCQISAINKNINKNLLAIFACTCFQSCLERKYYTISSCIMLERQINKSEAFCVRDCKTWGVNNRTAIWYFHGWDYLENRYCWILWLTYSNWLITVCRSWTCFGKVHFFWITHSRFKLKKCFRKFTSSLEFN